MDDKIRKKLRNVVTQCRKLLEESITQELEGKYSIFAKKDQVTADPDAEMPNLNEEEKEARKDILDHFAHIKARAFKPKEALDQLVREIAFTHLNRLCAYKMMEARDVYVAGKKFREAVSRGVNSNGVKFYLADHEDDLRLFETGQQDVAYRHFLDWLGGLLSDEIGVLFSPTDPANRLYPRQKTIDEVLDLLNGGGIKPDETELKEQWPNIWSQDETIGWVYQYFTPKEMRDKARKESQAPRNSYELAFRNQFFTPRYVVEFLTDNTLGQIWYEMRKGDTKLKDECRYMVRRPSEVFLEEGEQPPENASDSKDDLSQEELLKLPVHIPHRPKKDPRELKILDPACGSGHFLLYCFDLLLTIYEEAYDDPDLGPALQRDYPKFNDLRRDVPRLILAHNLHGIDIDLRASQIAALALWLRCQRAYRDMGLLKDRPKITRSNFVCAEPMPGEEQMLKEFVGQLEPKVLGQVVEIVFDKMKLAGEAGSLLKIEEEIRDAVTAAKKQFVCETTHATDKKGRALLFTEAEMERLAGKPEQQALFDLSDITDDQFFEQAEARVVEALRSYAEKAHNGQQLQRRLFTDDAVRGFAFVDLCQKQYDVVLMNPPFGKPSTPSLKAIRTAYPDNWKDVYAAFVERTMQLAPLGMTGAITSSQFLYTKQMRQLRQEFISTRALRVFIKLGHEVLDGAAVDTGLSILAPKGSEDGVVSFGDMSNAEAGIRGSELATRIASISGNGFRLDDFSHIQTTPFAFHSSPALLRLWNQSARIQPNLGTVATGNHTFDDERFVRLRWEVPTDEIDGRWKTFEKGGEYQPFFMATPLLLDWDNDGSELRSLNETKYGSDAQVMQSSKHWYKPGLCYSHVSSVGFGPRVLPQNEIFSSESIAIITKSSEDRLPLLGILCSTPCQELINVFGEYRKIENRAVSNLPISDEMLDHDRAGLNECATEGINLLKQLESFDETSPLFWGPDALVSGTLDSLSLRDGIHQTLIDLYERLDQLALAALGLPADRIEFRSRKRSELARVFVYRTAPSLKTAAHGLLSYCVGVAIGRWSPCPPCIDDCDRDADSPFAAIPRTAPAATRTEWKWKAQEPPVDILVDDAEHPHDIVRQIRAILDNSWKHEADGIEAAACEQLSVREIRSYFQRPGKGGFWDDHISRYSQSRRKAPIYWLLQSSKKNYALWLYYHRLDKDLLFKALVKYVEPKIRLEANRLETLTSEKAAAGDSGKEAKRLAKEVEKQEELLSELRDFEDKLRRAADLHLEPDLNDGVVLNIAPLHELVPWKVAKKYWDDLLAGKYEWSSIGQQLRAKGLVK